jgi:hypothetical protein
MWCPFIKLRTESLLPPFHCKTSYLWIGRFQFMIWKHFIFFFHSFIFILALYIGKDYVTSIYMYSSPFIVLFLCVYCLIDRCLRQETIFQLYRGGHLYWCSIIWNPRGVIYSLQDTHFRAGRGVHGGMVIGFITIYVISAYHH